jgi:hypothetical protein
MLERYEQRVLDRKFFIYLNARFYVGGFIGCLAAASQKDCLLLAS